MNRIRRTLVVAIIGMAILGFGLITAVEAVKPPLMPPDYDYYPGYPDASNTNGRIFPGFEYNPTYPYPWGEWNIMDESDASFIYMGWAYVVCDEWDETELFPQPIRVHVWIRPLGSGDDAWCEIDFSRNAAGHGLLGDPGIPEHPSAEYVGPVHLWYAYFEPYTWAPGEYETHMTYTCKDPNNPKNKEMVVWDPVTDEPLDYYGLFLVE